MTRRGIIATMCVIATVGIALRIANNFNRPLWQDEAETTINSLQVLDHGYPSDTFKGKPVYENYSYLETNDPKYRFASTNYIGSHFERNKGWLTYYYQAAFLKIFGFSTFDARVPFLLLSLAAFALLFFVGKGFFGTSVGIVAAALYAIDYYAIWFDAQARYYSLLTVLTLLLIFATYRSITTRSRSAYLCTGISLVLLFYTHLVTFVSAVLFVLIAHLFHTRRIRSLFRMKPLVMFLSVAVATLPWIVVVRFWTVAQAFYGWNNVPIWYLVLVLAVIAATMLLRIISPLYNYRVDLRTFSPLACLILYGLTAAVVKPILTPQESFGTRTFVELQAIFCILFAVVAVRFFKRPLGQGFPRLFIATIALSAVFVLFVGTLNRIEPTVTDARWVKTSIDYLDRIRLPKSTPVIVSFQSLPFMLYSDYNIDLVWPLRKSYLDTYPGRMVFIMDNRLLTPVNFLRNNVLPKGELNFSERIMNCAPTELTDTAYIYDCPPLPTSTAG